MQTKIEKKEAHEGIKYSNAMINKLQKKIIDIMFLIQRALV